MQRRRKSFRRSCTKMLFCAMMPRFFQASMSPSRLSSLAASLSHSSQRMGLGSLLGRRWNLHRLRRIPRGPGIGGRDFGDSGAGSWVGGARGGNELDGRSRRPLGPTVGRRLGAGAGARGLGPAAGPGAADRAAGGRGPESGVWGPSRTPGPGARGPGRARMPKSEAGGWGPRLGLGGRGAGRGACEEVFCPTFRASEQRKQSGRGSMQVVRGI